MNVLLLGSGGREHAIALALSKSPSLGTLIVAPGNPGTFELGRNVAVTDRDELLALAKAEAIELVVVGPEAPLVEGLADAFRDAGIAVFGPSGAAAQLEGSKTFTKHFCREFGIPTAAYESFTAADVAKAYVKSRPLPIVIKADGLAAGKGVIIAASMSEAESAIDGMFGGQFGDAGTTVVVEDHLAGEELSFFALCDGQHATPFASAQDYKRVGDGDTGPNTGGMGALSPVPGFDPAPAMAAFIRPALAEMVARGTPFRGILFAGLMMTAEGPRLIEYNVRFGDPECQALLPRLRSDLLPGLLAACDGELSSFDLRWRDEACVSVVMAAQGYPEAPVPDTVIDGLEAAAAVPGALVFQAGTRIEDGRLLAAGGRVLTICGTGPDLEAARHAAYGAVDHVRWPGGFCRRDIGARPLL
jgi:phosphoribosylamine--glycine ligase